MTRIILSEDCGNSPKNIFLTKLTTAFAKGDSKFILVSDKVIEGKDIFVEALKQMKSDEAVELVIHHVATHGKAGAVNGTTKLKNGKKRAFCDVYEFSNAKGTAIREITSYRIEIK